jgi:hypothetical protein
MLAAQQNAAITIRPPPTSALRSPQSSEPGLKMTARPARPKAIPMARHLVMCSDRKIRAPKATQIGVV